ncbi:MAG: fibronectin type III domain-containing protein, partial [Thermodesulfobacteriota bacterium]|nr:fibronectin type III domain-containing protein [Thermodesulfobacteriota bacterium]
MTENRRRRLAIPQWKRHFRGRRRFQHGWIVSSLLSSLLVFFLLVNPLDLQASDGPVIDVWYGLNQNFGEPGVPQRWVNILGNVTDDVGVQSLTYTLNGGPESSLSIGPDGRRLEYAGDFNVEIDYADLVDGENTVVITAKDTDVPENVTTETVTVSYAAGNVWPQTYSIDWETTANIQEVAQVVDGKWGLEPDGTGGTLGIRTLEIGYDRVLAIGEYLDWADYEITVPITINGFDPGPLPITSGSAGFGMTMRWSGHTDDPIICAQPHCGWVPSGAGAWYDMGAGGPLALDGEEDATVTIGVGDTFYWKFRVETVPGGGPLYSLKVWEDGEEEPGAWTLQKQRDLSDVTTGSLIFSLHHVDATIGDIEIVHAVVIGNVQVIPGDTEATVTWSTNVPATSRVDYGLTDAYEMGFVDDDTLVTEHSITLTGLAPETVYHYQITSANATASCVYEERFRNGVSNLLSDDFCGPSPDPDEAWTVFEPLGTSLTMTGTQASMDIPAGVAHGFGAENNTCRLMQEASDTDFELEVKFESGAVESFEFQGLLIEQDAENYLRFEFLGFAGATYIYACTVETGVGETQKVFKKVVDGETQPLYMRVKRTFDTWTVLYSLGGEDWESAVSFDHTVAVSSAGVHAGNTGSPPPAHTAVVDYFFNTASPVVPEDGCEVNYTLTMAVNGSGTTTPVIGDHTYAPDEVVDISADADPGWYFVS